MPSPLEYRKFIKNIKEEGCVIEDAKYPHRVDIYYHGEFLSSFSVTHGKRTKGDEVKYPYIRAFYKALERAKHGGLP